jgi:EmrB/QacA subfamily drug resistance transporter
MRYPPETNMEALAPLTSQVAPRVRDRRWLSLGVIGLAQLMVALDATVMNIALPSAQAALGFSDADRQWVITAYTLAFGGLLLLGGRIADSPAVGRKRALLIGLVGFALASAVSGAAPNLAVLIGARALQGAFAALLAPTALSLLALMFTEPHERAKAFGVYGAIAGSGAAIGLLVGGLLTQYFEWRWCLYVNVPIALIAALGARSVLPDAVASPGSGEGAGRGEREVRGQRAGLRADLPGLVLGSGGLTALVYACGQAAARGWTSPQVLLPLVAGGLGLVLFVVNEARTDDPLLPLHIVADRQRGPAYLSALLAVGGMFGAFLFLTYQLQVVLGFAPLQAGLAFLPMSASTLIVSTQVAPRLLPRVAPRLLMVPGFLLAALGMALLTRLTASSDYLTTLLPAEVLLGLGIACVMMPAASLATSGVAPRDAGIASATLNTAQQVGASLGTAVLNTLAASVTAGYLAANPAAPRVDALAHGYAAAAAWGAGLLLVGAAVAASLDGRRPY